MNTPVFVGIAQEIVAFGAVAAEIQFRLVKNGDQFGKPFDHLATGAQLCRVVEVGLIDDALQTIGFGQLADDLVDLVANLLVALEGNHVGKAPAFGNLDHGVFLTGIFVGDILYEEQDQDVVLVLAVIHASAKLIATFPKRTVKFRFLDSHLFSSAGRESCYGRTALSDSPEIVAACFQLSLKYRKKNSLRKATTHLLRNSSRDCRHPQRTIPR